MDYNDLVIESSGNVFADLGLSKPEERLAKAELAFKISEIINSKHLKQEDAAKLLHIPQPKVSLILNGKLSGISLEKLIHFLNLLDQDVQILVTERTSHINNSLVSKICEASSLIKNLFNFPVPEPKHPILANKMPLWDYSDDYLAKYI